MFVEGGDPLDVPLESLALTTSMVEEAAKAGNAVLLGRPLHHKPIALHCGRHEKARSLWIPWH